MTRILKLCAVACLAACVMTATLAADDDNVIRVTGIYSIPTSDDELSEGTVEADEAAGAAFSYESRITDLVGVNIGTSWRNYDIKLDASSSSSSSSGTVGDMDVFPLYAMILVHPVERGNMVDWYFGGGLAYVIYDSFNEKSSSGTNKRALDDEATWTVRTGIDFKFGDGSWALNVDAQYFRTEAEEIRIDPVDLGVGFSYRW